MKRILINKIINKCFECPMMNDEHGYCNYTGKNVEVEIPDTCSLPEAPVTKILKITRCIECPHCKRSNVSTCITTIPPIYERHYYCDLGSGWGSTINVTEEYAKKRIADGCILEDVE